jgi:hypothetical protein
MKIKQKDATIRSMDIEGRTFNPRQRLAEKRAELEQLIAEYVSLNPKMGYREIALRLCTNHDYVRECAQKYGTARKTTTETLSEGAGTQK